MQYQKRIIQQVPMVESQAANHHKRNINLPAAVFNRQPRQHQNSSILSNRPLTPTRKHGSVSPSKIKHDKSLKASSFIKNNLRELACTNHDNKPAQFMIETEDQQLPYCQKCSILLASQGFKLIKLNDHHQQQVHPLEAIQDEQRRAEIGEFLSKLEQFQHSMNSLKSNILGKINKSSQNFQMNVQDIMQYYQYLVDSIQRHKNETIELLAQHNEEAKTQIKSAFEMVNECIRQSSSMKQDIIGSIQIIKDAREEDFRPIMTSYYERIQGFSECLEQVKDCNISPISLVFNNVEDVAKQTTDIIQIGFDETTNYGTGRSSNPYFSFEEQVPEEAKSRNSKIFQVQKPQTAGYRQQNSLRNSNIAKSRMGESMAEQQ